MGDNLAINLINPRRISEGQLIDTLQSNNNERNWLKRLKVPIAKGLLLLATEWLLQKARELREFALAAVEDRKSGKMPSRSALNRFLGNAPSHTALVTEGAMNLRLARV